MLGDVIVGDKKEWGYKINRNFIRGDIIIGDKKMGIKLLRGILLGMTNATCEIYYDSKCVLKRVFDDFRKTREELGSKNTAVKKLSIKIT